MMSGSFSDFVEQNTGDAGLLPFRVSNIQSTKDYVELRSIGTVMHSPLEDHIEFSLAIDNPHNYSLAFTPVITEFYGPDGPALPVGRPIFIANQSPDIITIRIEDVEQGDAFRIRVDIASADGTRVFPSFSNIPRIICDHRLAPANPLDMYIDDGTGKVFVKWRVPPDTSHKYINKMSLTFYSRSYEPPWGPFSFNFTKDDKSGLSEEWLLESKDYAGADLPLVKSITDDNNDGQYWLIPFPGIGVAGDDIEAIKEIYYFKVDLKDKNGLISTAVFGGLDDRFILQNIIIRYRIRKGGFVTNIDSGYKFNNLSSFYKLEVPYAVEALEFTAIPTADNQAVKYGTDNNPRQLIPTEQLLPIVGSINVNKINMKVEWRNDPGSWELQPDESHAYEFEVLRQEPNLDSTLKGLKIFTTAGLIETEYPLVPKWDPPPNDVDTEINVATDYMVYVPSSVDKVSIVADYLSTAEIYNNNNPPNLAGYPKYLPLPDGYPTEGRGYDLKITQHGWISPALVAGSNFFRINVKPESDRDGSRTRPYTVNIVKLDPVGNTAAKLDELKLTTSAATGSVKLLAPEANDFRANPFHQDLLHYTALVPSTINSVAVNSITLEATCITGAIVTSVTSVNLDSSTADNLTYTPSGSVYTAATGKAITIPFNGSSGLRKEVTVTVNSVSGGPFPKEYKITLIKCLPKLGSTPQLTGKSESFELGWTTGATGAASYDVCYDEVKTDPYLNIPERAINALGSFSNNSSVSALKNNKEYNVWVRGVSSANIPGEWTQAFTTPLTGSAYNFGIPGAAELASLTPSVGTLSPFFSSSIFQYEMDLPATVTDVTFTPVKAWSNAPAPSDQGTFTFPAYGASATKTIRAFSADGKTYKDYSIAVYHRLSTPVLQPATNALDGAVTLSWGAVTNATGYEITDGVTSWTTAASSITVTGLTNAQTYNFKVRAVRTGFKYPSEWSDPVSAEPKNTTNTLKSLTAQLVSGSVTLDLVPQAGSLPNTVEYVVKTSTVGNIVLTAVEDHTYQQIVLSSSPSAVSSTSRSITVNPAAGAKSTVTIEVTSHSDVGVGANTMTYKIAVHRICTAPAFSSSTAFSNRIQLNWGGVAGAASYEIFYSKDSTFNESTAGKASTSGLTTIIQGLDNAPYYVWIRAMDYEGMPGVLREPPLSITPGNGNINEIGIVFNDDVYPTDHVYTMDPSAGTLSLKATTSTLTVQVPAGMAPYSWYVDGVLVSGQNGNSLTVSARQFRAGTHNVSVSYTFMYSGGGANVPYACSKVAYFTVAE